MRSRGWLGLLLPLALAGCSDKGERPAASASVTGTVSYRERIALPPDALIEVTLADVSRANAPGEKLAEAAIPASGRQVPIPFELRYDPEKIQSNHTYAVRASIRSGERLLFTTDTHYPVITQGHSAQVELALVRVVETGGLR